jgi:hypothetical protein
MQSFILDVHHTGQAVATQITPVPTAPDPSASAPTWSQLGWAQKFEWVAFLVAFGLIFLVLSVGVAIFGSPA